LLVVLAAVASPLYADDRDARRAYDAGRFDEARRLWLPPAAAGDAEAALSLGLLYDLGLGVPQDSSSAYRWYRQAAEGGLAQAAFNVGVMLDSGVGVPRDSAEAALWYAKAAAGGHHRAQYALFQLYAAGDGVLRNPATAEAWYRAAASGGIGAASARLSALLRAERATPSPPSGNLSPVRPVPVAPVDVVVPAGQRLSKVALVWNTPEQPVPVAYYVEIKGARCVWLARSIRELRQNVRHPRRAAQRAATLRVACLRCGKIGITLYQQRPELVLNRRCRGRLTSTST
jgi:TPR repeat protein